MEVTMTDSVVLHLVLRRDSSIPLSSCGGKRGTFVDVIMTRDSTCLMRVGGWRPVGRKITMGRVCWGKINEFYQLSHWFGAVQRSSSARLRPWQQVRCIDWSGLTNGFAAAPSSSQTSTKLSHVAAGFGLQIREWHPTLSRKDNAHTMSKQCALWDLN